MDTSMTVKYVFREAIKARDSNDYELAEKLLLSIAEQAQQFPTYHAVLGRVQWELKKLDSAIEAFHQAVRLTPNSEAVSLGLFHCLWEAGCTDDAFDEMKRFLVDNESVEYTQLLADISDSP